MSKQVLHKRPTWGPGDAPFEASDLRTSSITSNLVCIAYSLIARIFKVLNLCSLSSKLFLTAHKCSHRFQTSTLVVHPIPCLFSAYRQSLAM